MNRLIFFSLAILISNLQQNLFAADFTQLGNKAYRQGNYNKAIVYFEKGLKVKLKKFGHDHTSVAINYSNLGLAYHGKKQYRTAIGFFQKAINIEIKNKGSSHSVIATYYYNLSRALKEIGDYNKAHVYAEKAYNIASNIHGGYHHTTKLYFRNLVYLLSPKIKESKRMTTVLDLVNDPEMSKILIDSKAQHDALHRIKPKQYFKEEEKRASSRTLDELAKGTAEALINNDKNKIMKYVVSRDQMISMLEKYINELKATKQDLSKISIMEEKVSKFKSGTVRMRARVVTAVSISFDKVIALAKKEGVDLSKASYGKIVRNIIVKNHGAKGHKISFTLVVDKIAYVVKLVAVVREQGRFSIINDLIWEGKKL